MSINQLLAGEEKKKPNKVSTEKVNDTPSWMKNIKKKEVGDETKPEDAPSQPDWMSKVKKAPALDISFEKKDDQLKEHVEPTPTIMSPKRLEEKPKDTVKKDETRVNATPDWMKNIKKKDIGLVEEKPKETPSWMNRDKKTLGEQEMEELEKKKKEDEIKQKEMEERLRLDREKREKEKKDKEEKIRLKKEEEDRKFEEAQARYQKIHGKQNFGV